MAKTPKLPKISNSKFVYGNSAQANRVFLYGNFETKPFVRPIAGWEIVGHGKAPFPNDNEYFAVMFEKKTPAEKVTIFENQARKFPEGTCFWQHYRKQWVTL